MTDEKEKGITTYHIVFIANDLSNVISKDWQHIMIDSHNIYVELNSILWGALREQQNRIDNLESRSCEVDLLLTIISNINKT